MFASPERKKSSVIHAQAVEKSIGCWKIHRRGSVFSNTGLPSIPVGVLTLKKMRWARLLPLRISFMCFFMCLFNSFHVSHSSCVFSGTSRFARFASCFS